VQKLITLHYLEMVILYGSATIKEAQIENIGFIIKFQSIPSYTEKMKKKIHLHESLIKS
jgi:hypothetical protein